MTGAFIKKGNLHVDIHTGRTTCEDEVRDWGNVTILKTPKIASKTPEAGKETRDRFSLTALEGTTHSANTLIPDLRESSSVA